ncbi:hypothetical protein [Helicobacter cinaedi]|uniref:hypothetical protein n=1 Tax=Helicobacter cinaedi TaxID=213 RepID=UPI001FB28B11|nr:hypothetical protein [Helicobacter cinaedi]
MRIHSIYYGRIPALGGLTHTAKNLQQHTTFSLASLIDFVNKTNGGGGKYYG